MFYEIIGPPESPMVTPMPDSEDGSTPTGPGEANNEIGNTSPPTVVIAAGVVGGFVGLVALVAMCVCIGWLTRHIQVHVHYAEKNQPTEDGRQHRANSNEMLVQVNAAYRQALETSQQPINTTNRIAEEMAWMNEDHARQCGVPRGDGIHHESVRHNTVMSNNIAYHQGNTTWTTEGNNRRNYDHLTVPLPYEYPILEHQSAARDNSEDHPYDYIL